MKVQQLLFAALAASGVNAGPLVGRQNGAFDSPPYYPSPKGGWIADWSVAYAKAAQMVGQMTLAEKVNITTTIGWSQGLCVGNTGPVDRLGFPSICAQDGPLGIRFADLITAFPPGITTGATWDEELMYARAAAMGAEAKAKGVHVLLGPSVGPIGRSPDGGRNWEGFGSDPYLQGVGAFESVRGIQGAGVQATVKHYIANEQEHFRGDGWAHNTVSSNIDDRTLHELYLWPFSEAVRAGVASVMCSYNMVNGSYACSNSKLLNGVLKDELGFQGYVMADWLAQRSGVEDMLAGLDQTQPGDGESWANGKSLWGDSLSRSVLNSSVPVDRLNDAVTRIVAAWYQLGQDVNYPPVSFSSWTTSDTDVLYKGANTGPIVTVNKHIDVRGNHAEIAKAVARDGITLLKNVDNALPIAESDTIRVFGSDAGPNPNGGNSCVDRGCNSGVLGMGWGSGTADYYPDISTPIAAISARAANVQSILKDDVTTAVKQMAGTANSKCLVFISADAGERYITVDGNEGDRNSLYAWHSGDELVTAVADACPNTIVIMHTVGPIIVEKWIDHPNVKAVVNAHLPGREAGSSLTEILFGDVSPSGHLPYTMGKAVSDWGSSVALVTQGSGKMDNEYTEKAYIDYRWFDKQGIAPRFPFGFGLSYTDFTYSDISIETVTAPSELPPARAAKGATPVYPTTIPPAFEVAWPSDITTRISKYIYPYLDNPSTITTGAYPYPTGYTTTPAPAPAAGGAQGGNPALRDVIYRVTICVQNTGEVTGKAVPQLYLEFPSGIKYDTPIRQLRGFKKIELAPTEAKQVTFELTRKDLSVWDVVLQNWVIPGAGAGGYTVHVGDSSRNLPLSKKTTV
ncbi:beta-glucosidase-related glycosidase [Tricharina praecox]|uniref:beta-glucosidase-related glycosidase n=1 Tax=Tricharina praecox TaxID=43433 RepID=UPI00222089D7|nr:beta-glucosidase-related glycosidase [Tricharina praecox]KAI5854414.1 beta-glucosidase-related glycosidase [Tricharina praecox]